MSNKVDMLKGLRASPKYQRALKSARSTEERKQIAALVEGFVGALNEALVPLVEKAQSDPRFAQQLELALIERQGVVTSEPLKSGSTG